MEKHCENCGEKREITIGDNWCEDCKRAYRAWVAKGRANKLLDLDLNKLCTSPD